MTNLTVSYTGQVNGADDTKALFLKTFGGEVLTAFDENNVMEARHMIRDIQSGKSAQFPASWKVGAGYHTPGNQIVGSQTMKHNERVINVDALLISDVFLDNLQEAMNHVDYRSEYSKQVGAALARTFDQNTMRVAVLAARASATVTGGYGGAQVYNTSAHTDGSVLAGLIYTAAQTFDEKDVPADERSVIVKPAQYYLMAQNTALINKDWGGAGSYSDGKILRVADIDIVKSNNVPSTDVSAVSGQANTYSGDFTDTVAVAFHRSAIGTVRLMGLAVQMTGHDFEVMYQGTMIVGKYAMGHGITRPESAVEIRKAA